MDNQACIWLWDDTNHQWRKAACDSDGKLKVRDESAYSRLTLPSLGEYWQNLSIDVATWTVTDPATGTAWTPQVNPALSYSIMNLVAPNANEVARLVGNQVWPICTIADPEYFVLQRFIWEFEMYFNATANLDNTACFFGMTATQADTRASNNIMGFALLADVLQTVTDLGGVEETNTGFGETLTRINKFRMEAYEDTVLFYLNGTLIATHDTTVPITAMYPNLYLDTEAGGAQTFGAGVCRIYYEDVARA